MPPRKNKKRKRSKTELVWKCYYSDCGWCYHPDVTKPYACPGYDECSINVKNEENRL